MGKSQPELKLQQDCYKFFWNQYPNLRGCLWRVENERKRSKYEQMIAKSTGLVSGVSDMMMVFNGEFHAIELKTESGRQTESQKKWQETIEKQGGTYYIIRTLEEFQNLIKRIVE